MPSDARVCASITMRVEALGVAIMVPSLETSRELEFCTCSVTEPKYTSEYLRNAPDSRRISPSHAARSNPGHRQRFAGVRLRRFLGKVRRLILFFRAHRGVRLHVEIRRGGALVFAVGQLPQNARDGVGIVAERQAAGGHAAGTALSVRVVQRGRTHAHGHIGLAAPQARVGQQASVRSNQHDQVLVVDGVAEVVGRRLALGQVTWWRGPVRACITFKIGSGAAFGADAARFPEAACRPR